MQPLYHAFLVGDSFTSSETITAVQPLGFHSGLIRDSFGIDSGFIRDLKTITLSNDLNIILPQSKRS